MRAEARDVEQLTSPRSTNTTVWFIPTEEIDVGPPIEAAALDPLVRSVAARGIVQPLLVRREGGRYQVIAGHKRLAAARATGLPRVPCLVYHVDDEEARALREAENIQVGSLSPGPGAAAGISSGGLATELLGEVADIESAAAIAAGEDSPLARRVALDLVRARAWRAAWLLRSATILEDTHCWDFRSRRIGSTLERVCQGFAPESRLGAVDLQLCVPDWNLCADVDDRSLVVGVTGAVVATLALVGQPDAAVITLIASSSPHDSPSIEIAQDVAAVSWSVADRFFDPAWLDRPGGLTAAIGAAALKVIAERHGGNVALVARGSRGSAMRLNLGRVR